MAKDLSKINNIVFICNGGSCLKKGAEENTNILRQALKDHHLDDNTHTIKTRCSGQCATGPMVFVHPEGVWYKEIDAKTSRHIVAKHLLQKEHLKENLFHISDLARMHGDKRLTFMRRMFNAFLSSTFGRNGR
jgi:(2Fe-2S) ferredoxin